MSRPSFYTDFKESQLSLGNVSMSPSWGLMAKVESEV